MVQNATQHGRKTGVMIALGLSCGVLVHLILSLTGISYLVKQQPMLFNLLQLAGVSYLLYLGVGALQSVVAKKTPAHRRTALRSPFSAIAVKPSQRHDDQSLESQSSRVFVSLLSSLIAASMSVSGKVSAAAILVGLSLTWFSCLAWLLTTSALQHRMQRITRSVDSICAAVFILAGGVILWQPSSAIAQTFGWL
ncbi:LysE family translocator [Vibrio cholerae]|nr:LysE family translocator [Vibrio cholerae]